jgi:predicted dehydrogenase
MVFKVGVIGAGHHGARYIKHASNDVPGMTCAVLCRRDRSAGEALAAAWGCRFQAEASAVITDPDVDGLIICTPPAAHFPLARDVLAAGKPLLLEKPMTGTLAEARDLCRLDAESAAPPLLLAQTLRWNPVIQQVKRHWHKLGRIHLVRLAQRLAPTSLAWQRSPAVSVGGSVLLTGVHIFDLVRFLTDCEFLEVDSRQQNILNPDLEDIFLARAVLTDGTWASLEVSKYTRSRACWLEAVGEEGQMQADYQYGGIRLLSGSRSEVITADAATPTLPLLLQEWLAVVRKGAPVPVGVQDGLRTLEVVEACYRSHRNMCPVRIAELGA